MFRGLMQDTPLTLQVVLRRAAEIHPTKTITTRVGDGFATQTYGETVQRATRLAGALEAMGVGDGDRVGTFAWNTARHVTSPHPAPGPCCTR